jgi:UDP-N-acetylmuramyl pentapeptide phosphotransferase/UDP-N-acetylglucosamine-1-phosphate transferase
MIYLLYFILLFVMELAYFKIAGRCNIIDKPNERSSHTAVTLRGGGIVFYFGALLFFVANGFMYPSFFAGLTLISIVSFADDIKPQSRRLRLSIHLISMILMFVEWNLFALPWYFTFLALILCTGVLNACNFMDGINGITGIYSLVALAALWYVNNCVVCFTNNPLLYVIGLSTLVFGFFNFRKRAKCFAGDVGAVSMAFILIFLLGALIIKTRNFSYIMLLAVYGVDSVLTIAHRLILKENIFKPHRKHVYQLLANEMQLPHLFVSGIYGLLQGLIFIGLIVFDKHAGCYFIAVTVILSVIYLIIKKKNSQH